MKDYYNILGVPRTATAEEIKKAYKKSAMVHHPDRGGDQARFKEVSEAYEMLSDNSKRQMIDQGVDPLNPHHQQRHNQGSSFGFHFGQGPTMEDILRGFGFDGGPGFGQWQQPQAQRKNKSLNINLKITLEEAYIGCTKDLELTYPGSPNNVKKIKIEIPRGIDSGTTIRYEGMGDKSIQGLPAGDLLVSIMVMPHPVYAREGINLLRDIVIDCFSAVTGTVTEFNTLDDRQLQISVPEGIQPGTTLGLKNEGMRDSHGNVGKLYVRVNVQIPTALTPEQIELVEQIKKLR